MTGSSDRRVVEVDAAPDVVPLGEASEITDPGSVTAGACETYIDCVCNLDTARRAANPNDAGEPDCAAAQAEFTNHPELDGICHERLRSYKSWIESHNLFEDEGISVPASCL